MSRRDTFAAAAVLALFVVDRLTKAVVEATGPRALAPFLGLQPTRNAGIALSLPLPPALTSGLIAAVVVILFALAVQRIRQRRAWVAWALVAVGGFSNLLDRLRSGSVFDFIRIGPLPIFNLADLMILAGLVLLLRRDLTARQSAG